MAITSQDIQSKFGHGGEAELRATCDREMNENEMKKKLRKTFKKSFLSKKMIKISTKVKISAEKFRATSENS